ncbi:substrate-binding periplasmic protein [Fluviispira multicolorata]|uniref:Transporter substrate-binding domain-containing protein n=1 Tax=Fluviispira multicolorata TaxID=2654512 RepID=A0A833JF88_9BACT|nr:ABC transporter substrate-binding protein [Fluviispira multicolorata]KAB8033614.1 transporter substrate-binding domain-containing protein [Fluviispira multicolorata]
MRIIIIFLVCNLSFLIKNIASAVTVKWFTENFYPFNYFENGKLDGFSVEIVNEMLRLMNSKDSIEVIPFPRLINIIDKQPNTAGFSVYQTDENKDNYQWVGPLAKGTVGFFKRSDSKVSIKSLDDAKKKVIIGVQLGSSHEKFLNKNGFKNLYRVAQSQNVIGNSLIHMLISGRFDLWMATDVSVYARAEKQNIPSEKIIMAYKIRTNQLYIAFSKQTDPKIVKKYRKYFFKVKNSPFYQDLFLRYSKYHIKKP